MYDQEITELTIQKTEIGSLVSRLDHPVYLSYDGKGMVIPPRGVIGKVTKNLLGAIPKGLTFIPNKTE